MERPLCIITNSIVTTYLVTRLCNHDKILGLVVQAGVIPSKSKKKFFFLVGWTDR